MTAARSPEAAAFWTRCGWSLVGCVEGALGDAGDGLLFNRRV